MRKFVIQAISDMGFTVLVGGAAPTRYKLREEAEEEAAVLAASGEYPYLRFEVIEL